MSKRIYNNRDGIFLNFLEQGIPKMKIDYAALGYKNARSAHRSLHKALSQHLHSIIVKWSKGDVYLVRINRR